MRRSGQLNDPDPGLWTRGAPFGRVMEESTTGQPHAQAGAALEAAETRRAIARKIAELVPKVKDDAAAQMILHLAEAYAHLASEPPRARAG